MYAIPRVRQLRQIDGMSLIHKIKYRQIRNNMLLMTFEDVHHYDTRNRRDFVIPKSKSHLHHNSLLSSGLFQFNSLPDIMKKDPNFTNFKKTLRKFILQSNVWSLFEACLKSYLEIMNEFWELQNPTIQCWNLIWVLRISQIFNWHFTIQCRNLIWVLMISQILN